MLILDLDGTIFEEETGLPIQSRINEIKKANQGIIILTHRTYHRKEETQIQLAAIDLDYQMLVMREHYDQSSPVDFKTDWISRKILPLQGRKAITITLIDDNEETCWKVKELFPFIHVSHVETR